MSSFPSPGPRGFSRRTLLAASAAGLALVAAGCTSSPPDERERIFEPFHRLRKGGRGTGLGLDLVRKIMRRHGGRVEVVDGPTEGACLRMSFPPPNPVDRR